jgi:hypothetical protein
MPMRDSSLPPRCLPPQSEPLTLFSRDKLLQEIEQRLQDGHKVLLVGPEGIGKSALIQALLDSGLDRRLDRAVVACRESTGVRAIVDAAEGGAEPFCAGSGTRAEKAWARGKPGRPKGGLRDRRSALYRRVQQGQWLFVLDHLSSCDPGIRHLLEYLFDYDVLALGAARGAQATDLGNVAKTLWRWDLVRVPPLGMAACKQLLKSLTCNWPLDPDRLGQFGHRLLQLADGIPGRIVVICRRARALLDRAEGRIDPSLLWLDWLAEHGR